MTNLADRLHMRAIKEGSKRDDHSFNSTCFIPPKEIRQEHAGLRDERGTQVRIFERH